MEIEPNASVATSANNAKVPNSKFQIRRGRGRSGSIGIWDLELGTLSKASLCRLLRIDCETVHMLQRLVEERIVQATFPASGSLESVNEFPSRLSDTCRSASSVGRKTSPLAVVVPELANTVNSSLLQSICAVDCAS